MKLDEINKIIQTTDIDLVNNSLASGYRLIKIFSSKISSDSIEQILPIYILGLKQK